MITLIEYLHSRGILHRDLKPDNLCMGVGHNCHKLYLIDFGLSKSFWNREGRHIEFREGKSLTGTARYTSIGVHKGYEHSRRDDMESIAYVILYLLKGSLPWQGMKNFTKCDKYKRIRDSKMSIPI